MKTVIIDNYDSFTYNLRHLVKSMGVGVTVLRNDRFELPDLEQFDKIILSPGPGIPSEAGLLLDVIRTYATRKPILGVCLGHQAIGEVFGGSLINLKEVYHGVATPCHIISPDLLLRDVSSNFMAGRYHSWVVSKDDLPDCLQVTATSEDGQIMAMHHKKYPVYGVQFHPESILTPEGDTIIQNFIEYIDIR